MKVWPLSRTKDADPDQPQRARHIHTGTFYAMRTDKFIAKNDVDAATPTIESITVKANYPPNWTGQGDDVCPDGWAQVIDHYLDFRVTRCHVKVTYTPSVVNSTVFDPVTGKYLQSCKVPMTIWMWKSQTMWSAQNGWPTIPATGGDADAYWGFERLPRKWSTVRRNDGGRSLRCSMTWSRAADVNDEQAWGPMSWCSILNAAPGSTVGRHQLPNSPMFTGNVPDVNGVVPMQCIRGGGLSYIGIMVSPTYHWDTSVDPSNRNCFPVIGDIKTEVWYTVEFRGIKHLSIPQPPAQQDLGDVEDEDDDGYVADDPFDVGVPEEYPHPLPEEE